MQFIEYTLHLTNY